MDDEMLIMAYVYANVCTQQQEKYEPFGYRDIYNLPWEWEDCQASWEFLKETTTGIARYEALKEAKQLCLAREMRV